MELLCIFCKKPQSKFSEEHIFPDSLGCPPDFVLLEEVCQICNNKLGRLDNSVVQAYDILRWMKGIKNKDGKLPKVSSIRNIHTDNNGYEGQQRLVINAGKNNIDVDGKKLPGYRKNSSSLSGRLEVDGEMGTLRIRQPFNTDRTFIRGIYKIGFEIQCLLDGREHMLLPFYDSYRDFIYNDVGDEELFYRFHDDGEIENSFNNFFHWEDGKKMPVFRLLNVTYYVNLSGDEAPYDALFKYKHDYNKKYLKYVKTKGTTVEYW